MPKPTFKTAFPTPFSPFLALAISPSDILDTHRLIAGDLRMEDEGDKDKGADDEKGKDKGSDDDKSKDKGGDDDKDKPLGPGGEKALIAERDARKKAETDAKAVKDQMDGFFTGLKGLLGLEEKGNDPEKLVTALTERLANLETNTEVDALARTHKITDENDIAILRSTKDPEIRKSLAERFAPKDEDDKGKGKGGRTPRSDTSQGKGGDGAGSRPTSVSQVIADRRAARDGKAKQ